MHSFVNYGLYFYLFSPCRYGFIQAAVYGLGVCAEFGGSAFKQLVGGRFPSAFLPPSCVSLSMTFDYVFF